MKKGIILSIVAILVLAIVGFGIKYYNDRYSGSTYYMKAPAAPAATFAKDDSGKLIYEKGEKVTVFEYKDVEFISKDGDKATKRNITWESTTPMVEGGFYSAELSSQIIVKGPNAVLEKQVPAVVISKFN